MSARKTLPLTTILLSSILTMASWDSTASEREPDAAELERVSSLLNLPLEMLSDIYPSLVRHKDVINEQVVNHNFEERLKWRAFVRIRTHAKTTANAIRPYLSKRDTYQVMRNLHAYLVPKSIRPRQDLGELFDRSRPRYDGFPIVDASKTAWRTYSPATNCAHLMLKYGC